MQAKTAKDILHRDVMMDAFSKFEIYGINVAVHIQQAFNLECQTCEQIEEDIDADHIPRTFQSQF